jgi:AcrR family transcriptional regulator
VLANLHPVGRRILEAARAIVAEGGLDGLSLQAAATKAGVHKSAIAYHFGSKDGLLHALAELLFEEYPSATAGRPEPSQDAAGRVADRFRVLRTLAKDREYWSLAYALWPLTQLDASVAARAEGLKQRGLGRVAASLGLSADHPADVALINAIDAAIAGLALDFTFDWDPMMIDASLDRLEEAFTPLLLQAIARREASTSASSPERAARSEEAAE